MTAPERKFTDSPAVRERVPMLLGLVGPSGSGKTYSMLRLLSGIQKESGGDIYVIDTEGRRALQYADQFRFRHVPFESPFSPLDYLAVIKHCVSKGARNIGIDSMSHEHEGAGGVLDMHEAELDRMTARVTDEDARDRKREAANWRAWATPKADRRRLLNEIIQLGLNMVFCFRAKEKTKQVKNKENGKQELIALGWQAIAGEEFIFEMIANLLLPPGSAGVPSLKPEIAGERALVKVPSFFLPMLSPGKPLDEEVGQRLARWAAGDQGKEPGLLPEIQAALKAVCGDDQASAKVMVRSSFGVAWSGLAGLPEDQLRAGLAKIKAAREQERHDEAAGAAELAAGVRRGESPQEPVALRLSEDHLAQLRTQIGLAEIQLEAFEARLGCKLEAYSGAASGVLYTQALRTLRQLERE